jgi:hypothetical protein
MHALVDHRSRLLDRERHDHTPNKLFTATRRTDAPRMSALRLIVMMLYNFGVLLRGQEMVA